MKPATFNDLRRALRPTLRTTLRTRVRRLLEDVGIVPVYGFAYTLNADGTRRRTRIRLDRRMRAMLKSEAALTSRLCSSRSLSCWPRLR